MWAIDQARSAVEDAGFHFLDDDMIARKVVSAEGAKNVLLNAEIRMSDHRVVLWWNTNNNVRIGDSVSVVLDQNCGALLAAIASAEVSA